MSTVLWGARRGDVQYGSRSYWRTRIPIGAVIVEVSSTAYFGPGETVEVSRTGEQFRVLGLEPPRRLGVARM